MKIYNDLEELIPQLKGKFLFFDTSSLIAILEIPELFDIFEKLKQSEVAFVTIKSVYFEFTRTDNIANYNKRVDFLNSFLQVFSIEDFLSSIRESVITLQRTVGSRLSYPDFLLYCCLIKFPNSSYLVTENHKDFTPAILDREMILTIDDGKNSIRNTAFYKLCQGRYSIHVKSIDSSHDKPRE